MLHVRNTAIFQRLDPKCAALIDMRGQSDLFGSMQIDSLVRLRFLALLGIAISLAAALLSTFGVFAEASQETNDSVLAFCFLCAVLATIAWNSSRIAAVALAAYVTLEVFVVAIDVADGKTAVTLLVPILGMVTVFWVFCLVPATFTYFKHIRSRGVPPAGSESIRWLGNIAIVLITSLLVIGFAISGGDPDYGDPPEQTIADLVADTALRARLEDSEAGADTTLLRARMDLLRDFSIITTEQLPELHYIPTLGGEVSQGALVFGRQLKVWRRTSYGGASKNFILGEICAIEESPSSAPLRRMIGIRGLDPDHQSGFFLIAGDRTGDLFIESLRAKNEELMNWRVRDRCDLGVQIDWADIAEENNIPTRLLGEEDISKDLIGQLLNLGHLNIDNVTDLQAFYSGATYDLAERGILFFSNSAYAWRQVDGEIKTWTIEYGSFCDVRDAKIYVNSPGKPVAILSWRSDGMGVLVLPEDESEFDWIINRFKDRSPAPPMSENLQNIACQSALTRNPAFHLGARELKIE